MVQSCEQIPCVICSLIGQEYYLEGEGGWGRATTTPSRWSQPACLTRIRVDICSNKPIFGFKCSLFQNNYSKWARSEYTFSPTVRNSVWVRLAQYVELVSQVNVPTKKVLGFRSCSTIQQAPQLKPAVATGHHSWLHAVTAAGRNRCQHEQAVQARSLDWM